MPQIISLSSGDLAIPAVVFTVRQEAVTDAVVKGSRLTRAELDRSLQWLNQDPIEVRPESGNTDQWLTVTGLAEGQKIFVIGSVGNTITIPESGASIILVENPFGLTLTADTVKVMIRIRGTVYVL